MSVENYWDRSGNGKRKNSDRNPSQYRCIQQKPVPVSLYPTETLASITVSNRNPSQYHCIQQKPVPLSLYPTETRPSITVSNRNPSHYLCIQQKPVPLSLYPTETRASIAVSNRNPCQYLCIQQKPVPVSLYPTETRPSITVSITYLKWTDTGPKVRSRHAPWQEAFCRVKLVLILSLNSVYGNSRRLLQES
jgi:hypothetical protein